jgi:uncharacterized protein YegL
MSRSQNSAKDAITAHKEKKAKGTKHVFVLMDESGSMHGLEEAVTTGCNEFIHEFKDDPDVRIWLAWFDHTPGEDRTRFKVRGKKAAKVKQLTAVDYCPRGTTPLNDAIADSVSALDAASGDDDIVFLAVITDGMENASEHSTKAIKSHLTARKDKGWSVVFVGANQNTVGTAAAYGVDKLGRAFNFDANRESTRKSMKGLSNIATARLSKAPGKAGLDEFDLDMGELFSVRELRLDED